MPISAPVAHLRAALGNASLRGDTEAVARHKRDLTALLLEEHICRVLATAPPLTTRQRGRIAAALRAPVASTVVQS